MSDIIATFPQASSPAVNASNTNASRPSLARQVSARTIQQRSSRQAPPPAHAMDSATAEATCKKLVSILALAAGFEGITASALESLTRSFENYTQQMYSIAHSFAELAGRTRPNIHDLQQAFADMNLNPASLESYARKASHSGTPLLRGPLQETLAKKEQKKETKTDLLDSDIEDNSDSDEEDEKEKQAAGPKSAKVTARTVVPDHLPAFPSKHSYKQTPVFVTRPTDPQAIRELNAEQSRLVETNLKRLMAAENKVAMAAHKDTLQQDIPVADLLTSIKEENFEEVESQDLRDLRARTKLEVLPVVNYEYSKRSSSTVIREPVSKGHSDLTGGDADTQVGSVQGSKAEWRKERRRLRKEKNGVLEEMDPNSGTHKRIRSDTNQGVRSITSLHGSNMELDRQQ
ncbi:transcription initiation factor TFIID subunit 8 [Entomortierella parvispora]|uniref:Transcription initiation factor TFIID subunit 8 n=1 Tax=Entomortierella parvispora TaxID=205924 RepID=A0A9P3HB01_9FUNG|nr:transcription initiation factor TFIID subunit 8 [Entomortierella parvispora]